MGWEKLTGLFGLQSQWLILAAPLSPPKLRVQHSIRNQWRHSTKFLWFSSFPLDISEGERGVLCLPSVWLSSLCSDTISITEDWEVWKVFRTFFLISNQLSCVNQCYCTDSGLTRLLIRTLDRTVIRLCFYQQTVQSTVDMNSKVCLLLTLCPCLLGYEIVESRGRQTIEDGPYGGDAILLISKYKGGLWK